MDSQSPGFDSLLQGNYVLSILSKIALYILRCILKLLERKIYDASRERIVGIIFSNNESCCKIYLLNREENKISFWKIRNFSVRL